MHLVIKKILHPVTIAASILIGSSSLLSAQIYALTEQSWSNPRFKADFIDSYLAVSSEINPSITPEEKGLFDQIVPLIESSTTQAIALLKSSIKNDNSAAFDFVLGNLLYQEGEIPGAIASYRKAISKFPNYQMAYYNMGRSEVNAGNYKDALSSLQKALKLRGGDGTLYGLIGYCYLNLEQYNSALDAYRLAIMLAPESRDWKLGKLQCLISLYKTDEAISLLYEFISQEPTNAAWWKAQANQFVASENPVMAAANLSIMQELGAADGSSLVLLGDILLNQEIYGPAVEIYKDALESADVNPERIMRVIGSLISLEEYGSATELMAKLESSEATRGNESLELEKLNLNAQIAMGQEEPEKAAKLLEEVVARDPMNGRALLTLSKFYSNEGDQAKAEFYAENASKVDAVAHQAFISLAQIKVKQRNYAEAAKFLRHAQAIDHRDYIADYLIKVEQAALRM